METEDIAPARKESMNLWRRRLVMILAVGLLWWLSTGLGHGLQLGDQVPPSHFQARRQRR